MKRNCPAEKKVNEVAQRLRSQTLRLDVERVDIPDFNKQRLGSNQPSRRKTSSSNFAKPSRPGQELLRDRHYVSASEKRSSDTTPQPPERRSNTHNPPHLNLKL
jgi:hypothetical protein